MATTQLSVSASVVLDDTGAGSVAVGPTSQGEQWTVASVGVHCSTNVNESMCRVYAGNGDSSAYFVDATTWGSTGDSTDSVAFPIMPGMSITAVWSGGDAGATAYVSVYGTRTV